MTDKLLTVLLTSEVWFAFSMLRFLRVAIPEYVMKQDFTSLRQCCNVQQFVLDDLPIQRHGGFISDLTKDNQLSFEFASFVSD